jgi:hypothetical protein
MGDSRYCPRERFTGICKKERTLVLGFVIVKDEVLVKEAVRIVIVPVDN